MKYKTTVEIITEAENKTEATEIAGEYLSGNLMSGVDMKCLTREVRGYRGTVVGAVAVCLVAIIVAFSAIQIRSSQNPIPNITGISAIQPPLKTSAQDKKNAEFKKEWESKQTKKVLDYLKR